MTSLQFAARVLAVLAAIFVISQSPVSAQSESCGPNAFETGRTESNGQITLSCSCATGYVVSGGACSPILKPSPRKPFKLKGFVGGIGWRIGYYSPVGATEEMRRNSMDMMRKNSELAGKPYSESVDFGRYDFVVGIARSTSGWSAALDLLKPGTGDIVDLLNRGWRDEHPGEFLEEMKEEGFNAIRGREFDELGCHSNGAMICLAALYTGVAQANDVVLYGPQLTTDSLKLWNALLKSGKIQSLTIYVNENDAVPPAALLLGRPALTVLQNPRSIFFDVKALETTIHELSPNSIIHTFSCGTEPNVGECHSMRTYTQNRGCAQAAATRSEGPSPRVNGRRSLEPPSPNCPH